MIITTAVIKGGGGKSTTAAALLQAAAAEGLSALGIDLDPQGNLSYYLAADKALPGALEFLHGAGAADVIQRTEQDIDVISAAPDLATERTRPGSARRLQTALEPIAQDYDLIAIDTPPTIGELVYNALAAADLLISPIESDVGGIQGFYQVIDVARQMDGATENLLAGVLLTRHNGRAKVNRRMMEITLDACGDTGAAYLGYIRQDTHIRQAQTVQQSLYRYAPKCNAAADYMDLFRTLTGREAAK